MYNRANSDIYSMKTEGTEWGWNEFVKNYRQKVPS